MNIYAEIFKAFNGAKIEYLIVGGVAVNLYGYNRFTGDIDILVEESLVFEKQFEKRTKIKVWDMQLPVVSLENLIGMKKKANRQKDIDDVKALLELKNL
jgi:predicted nucleotidyltransferase